MNDPTILAGRFEIVHPRFFSIPLRDLAVEMNAVTNRTYFVLKDHVVAVAVRRDDDRG
jgi:hypothetical protein